MKKTFETSLSYLALAMMLCGSTALSSPAAAGNAYGRDDNPGNANGHAENGGPADPGGGADSGNLAAARGSLNAANASGNGLAHASKKSRPGMLAEYMDAMVVYETEYGEVDWNAYNSLMNDYDALQAEADALYAEYEELAAAEDPDADDKLAEYEAKQDEADAKLAEANALTEDLDAAAADAAGHLEDAANKDGMIDAEVVDSVNDLLDGKSEDFTHSAVVHESEGHIADIVNPPSE